MVDIDDDKQWADCCEDWSKDLRLMWSEVGVPHLRSGSDSNPPREHTDPGAHVPDVDTPEIGKPVVGPTGADEDVLKRWHEIDDVLREYFATHLRSGSLDAQKSFLHQLSEVSIGGITGPSNASTMPEHVKVNINSIYVDKNIGKMRDGLDYWKGEARDNFKEYLRDMEAALTQYQGCVAATWVIANKYVSMVRKMRRDVKKLVDSAHKIFDKRNDVDNQQQLTLFNALLTTGITVAGAPGATAAAGLAVGGSLKDGAVNAAVLDIGVDGRGDAIEKVAKGVQKIEREAGECAEKVKNALYSVTRSLTGDNLTGKNDAKLALRPKRPDIVTDDKFDSGDFYHDDQPAESREGASDDELVEEPKKEHDHHRDHHIWNPEDWRFDDEDDDSNKKEKDKWDSVELPDTGRKPDAYEEQ